jgi:hypothetical protein
VRCSTKHIRHFRYKKSEQAKHYPSQYRTRARKYVLSHGAYHHERLKHFSTYLDSYYHCKHPPHYHDVRTHTSVLASHKCNPPFRPHICLIPLPLARSKLTVDIQRLNNGKLSRYGHRTLIHGRDGHSYQYARSNLQHTSTRPRSRTTKHSHVTVPQPVSRNGNTLLTPHHVRNAMFIPTLTKRAPLLLTRPTPTRRDIRRVRLHGRVQTRRIPRPPE